MATGLNNLAALLQDQGELDEAKPLYEQALEIDKKAHGSNHPRVATGLNNLAGLLQDQGELDKAKPLYEQALEIFKKVVLGQAF